MGPSNLRDTTGRVVDTVFDPLNWGAAMKLTRARGAHRVLAASAPQREQLIETVDDIRSQLDRSVHVDPYRSVV
jgi:ABC-type transporter lipoprotein component MlaA